MPILVTGATGFLGHTLCPHLIARGHPLRAFVRPTADSAFLRPLGIEIAHGDIRDLETIQAATQGCRAVIHAAGKFRLWGKREDFEAVNTLGTKNALEAARRAGVERFVYISTIAVIGAPQAGLLIDENTPPHPQDFYQRSKLEAEWTVREYQEIHKLPTIILRPGAFYGPGGRYAFNRLFFEDPLKGLPLRVHKSQHVTFPVYIRDAAEGIRLALERGRPGELYNVSGRSISHQEINETLSRLLGQRIRWLNTPATGMLLLARLWTWLSYLTGKEPYYPINLAPYVFHDWQVSSEKAKRELGFDPTPFEEGARATLDWYRQMDVKPTNWLTRLIARITWRDR